MVEVVLVNMEFGEVFDILLALPESRDSEYGIKSVECLL